MWVDLVRQALATRPDVKHDGALCRALLNDLAANTTDSARYVGVLSAAVDAGVPAALEAGADPEQLAVQLAHDRGIEVEGARFAVTTWRAALVADQPPANPWQPPVVAAVPPPIETPHTELAPPVVGVPSTQPLVEPDGSDKRSKAPLFIGLGVLALLLVGGLLLFTGSGDDDDSSASATTADTATTVPETTAPDTEPATTATTQPATTAPATTAPPTTAEVTTTVAATEPPTTPPTTVPPPPPPITDDQLFEVWGDIASNATVLDAAAQAAQIDQLANGTVDFPVATTDMSHTICHGYLVPGPFDGEIVLEFNREIVAADAVSTAGGVVGLCYVEPAGFPEGSFQGYLRRGEVRSYASTVTIGRAPVGLRFYNDLDVEVCDLGISSNLTNYYDWWTFDVPLAPGEWFQIEAALIENDVLALDCDGNEASVLSNIPPTDKLLNLSNGQARPE